MFVMDSNKIIHITRGDVGVIEVSRGLFLMPQ